MNKYLNTTITVVMIVVFGSLLLNTSVNAATVEDAKKSVLNGEGEMVNPNMHRDSTDEETKANKNVPYQVFRKMTKEEASEYFSYIDKYQSKNNTNSVPDNAYDYIQYITEQLDKSKTKTITNELRAEAENYVKTQNNSDRKSDTNLELKSKKETKEPKKSFWKNFLSFNWLK